jgi:hypothetical protein
MKLRIIRDSDGPDDYYLDITNLGIKESWKIDTHFSHREVITERILNDYARIKASKETSTSLYSGTLLQETPPSEHVAESQQAGVQINATPSSLEEIWRRVMAGTPDARWIMHQGNANTPSPLGCAVGGILILLVLFAELITGSPSRIFIFVGGSCLIVPIVLTTYLLTAIYTNRKTKKVILVRARDGFIIGMKDTQQILTHVAYARLTDIKVDLKKGLQLLASDSSLSSIDLRPFYNENTRNAISTQIVEDFIRWQSRQEYS